MGKKNSWKRIFIGGVVATAVTAGVAAFTLTPDIVSAQDAPTDAPAVEESGRRFGRGGHGGPAGMMGHGMKGANHGEYLADALGINVDELDAAQAEARDAAIAQLLEEGVITQEQADQMAEREGRFGGQRFAARGHFGPSKGSVDHDALLADALDISVDELQAAKDAAREAGLAEAIEQGDLTEEQAEQMRAMQALHDYIDREAILADALGLTVEQLQAAHEEGTLRDVIGELDRDQVKETMQAGFEEAVVQAVAEGVITQEQADALQSGEGLFSGHGGRGRGGLSFPGMRPDGSERGEGFERGDGESTAPRGPSSQSRA